MMYLTGGTVARQTGRLAMGWREANDQKASLAVNGELTAAGNCYSAT